MAKDIMSFSHPGTQKILEDAEVIRRSINLEVRLIDDLLDLTKIGQGKISLHFEVADIQLLLSHTLQLFKFEIRDRCMNVEVINNARNCCVYCDPARIQQILWNLVKNALKFTDAHGRII